MDDIQLLVKIHNGNTIPLLLNKKDTLHDIFNKLNKKVNNTWTIQQKIVPNLRISGDKFGTNVIISPDTNYAVISSSFGNKAYVFKRTGTNWEQSSVLVNASPVSNDRFGWDIAYDGLNVVHLDLKKKWHFVH
mgnify:CR=1 FL=1